MCFNQSSYFNHLIYYNQSIYINFKKFKSSCLMLLQAVLAINLKTVWNTGMVDTDDMEISNKNLRYSGIVQNVSVLCIMPFWLLLLKKLVMGWGITTE